MYYKYSFTEVLNTETEPLRSVSFQYAIQTVKYEHYELCEKLLIVKKEHYNNSKLILRVPKQLKGFLRFLLPQYSA